MNEIRDCQAGIARRGGIFRSKEKIREEREAGRNNKDQQFKRHRAWLRKWRSAKATAWRDIERFEHILTRLESEPDVLETQQAKDMIRLALAKWERGVDRLTVIPGVKCIDSEDGDTDDEDADDDDTVAAKSPDNKAIIKNPAPHVTVPYTFPMPPSYTHQHSNQPDRPPPKNTFASNHGAPIPDTTSPESIPLPESDDTDIAQEITPTSPPPQNSTLLAAPHESPLRRLPKSPSTPSKPALLPRSSTPKTPRFAEIARIAVDAADESPPAVIEQPHNAHTTAERSRHAHKFHRTKSFYCPGEWSSPVGYKKVDTSSPGEETAWWGEDEGGDGDGDGDDEADGGDCGDNDSNDGGDGKQVDDTGDEDDVENEYEDEDEDDDEHAVQRLKEVEDRIETLTLRLIAMTRR